MSLSSRAVRKALGPAVTAVFAITAPAQDRGRITSAAVHRRRQGRTVGAERDRVAGFGRLEDGLRQASDWYLWGPYVSERQWGTVREDYSADGEAWDYLPHDHARSRAYRWGEDGLAGFCDVEQRLCLGLALWNGRDPILKERAVRPDRARRATTARTSRSTGGTSTRCPATPGTAGATTTRRRAFPYEDLRRRRTPARNGATRSTSCSTPACSTTTGTGSSRSTTPRPSADDLLMTIQVTNAGPETDTLHVLPTAWFRNTWSWDVDAPQAGAAGGAATGGRHRPSVPRRARAARRPRAGRDAPDAAVLRERDQHQRLYGCRAAHAVPQGRHQRPRGQRGGHRQPGQHRHQVRVLVPADGRARPDRRAAAAAAPAPPRRARGKATDPLGAQLRPGDRAPAGRGRRVLRRADPGRARAPTRRW